MNIQEAIKHRYSGDKPNYAPIERTTLTVQEVAIYLGLSSEMIYKLVRQSQIPHIRLGSRIVFKKDSINRWLDDLEQEA